MMECATVSFDCDGETFAASKTCIRTARTEHKCGECKRVIAPGEKYEITEGLCEGTWETYKTCSDCLSIRGVFFKDGFYLGEVIFMLHEHINECMGEISSDCITPLTPVAQERVCKMVEDAWPEDMEDAA